MLEFVNRALVDGCDYFIKNLSNEIELNKTLNEENSKKMKDNVVEMKQELTQCKEQFDVRIRALETERAQLSAKEQTLKETLAEVKHEKEANEADWRSRMDTQKDESNRMVEEYKQRMYQTEEKSKEQQRHVMASESEFDKEKALLEQKIQYLESNAESFKEKEVEMSSEIKSQKKELIMNLKESSTKFEKQIKGLQDKLEVTQEKLVEKEGEILDKDQKYEMEVQNLTEQNKKMNSQLSTMTTQMEQLKAEKEEMEKDWTANSSAKIE